MSGMCRSDPDRVRPLSLRDAWPSEVDLMAGLAGLISSSAGATGAERGSTRQRWTRVAVPEGDQAGE